MLGVLLLGLVGGCAKKRTVIGLVVDSGMENFHVAGAVGLWAPAEGRRQLVPLERWIRAGDDVGFSYVDTQKGLSVQWRRGDDVEVRRLMWAPESMEVLDEQQVRSLGLPQVPVWRHHYGPPDLPGTLYGHWRTEVGLKQRFHPDYPDDLRVVIGQVDGGRVQNYELIWVGVRSCVGQRCEGALLNQPNHPPLALWERVWFDTTDVEPDRLPAAIGVGALMQPELVAFAATSPELEHRLQDVDIWTWDSDVPKEQRMLQVGRWARNGGVLYYLYLGDWTVLARPIDDPGVQQTLVWMPRGMTVLTDQERIEEGLPEVLEIPGAPPQPPAGLWAGWRVDPKTRWLFTKEGQPDAASVMMRSQDGSLRPGSVLVRSCDDTHCRGIGLDNFGAALGPFQFLFLEVPGDAMVPLAWPEGEERPIGDLGLK